MRLVDSTGIDNRTSKKMKISLTTLAMASASIVKREDQETAQGRKYSQLMAMMTHYNPDFDFRKYFAYGCHCMIGKAPLANPGHGSPVDGLDSICRNYKKCLKCAKSVFGDTCVVEKTTVSKVLFLVWL